MFTSKTAEGTIPNWKNISILILTVAVIGLATSFIIQNLSRGETAASIYEELDQEAHVVGVTVKTSVAPEAKDKISVMFQVEESDLKYSFLSGDGKVKNISSRTIQEMILTYKVSGYDQEFSLPYSILNLNPGEEAIFSIMPQKLSSNSNNVVFGARIMWGAETSSEQAPAIETSISTNNWKIQTSQGELTIIYRETDNAKGKIKLWVDEKRKVLVIQNLLDNNIDTWTSGMLKDSSGDMLENFSECHDGPFPPGITEQPIEFDKQGSFYYEFRIDKIEKRSG